MLGILIALAGLALLLGPSDENVHATVVEADNGTFRFEGIKGGKVVLDDGPFASAEAAQVAADNWIAAQKSKPVALGCAGSGTSCRGAALGYDDPGQSIVVRSQGSASPRARVMFRTAQPGQSSHPYSVVRTRKGAAIDIHDLHAMVEWAKAYARQVGISDNAPAGVALRTIARRLTGGFEPVAVKLGSLGDDEWRDVMRFVRARVRPFTWGRLVAMAHARIHELGLAPSHGTSEGPGPGETGINAAGGLYVRTSGKRRL